MQHSSRHTRELPVRAALPRTAHSSRHTREPPNVPRHPERVSAKVGHVILSERGESKYPDQQTVTHISEI